MSIGAEDACDTGLVLGLGPSHPSPLKSKPSSSSLSSSNPKAAFEPSLTLGLSDAADAYRGSTAAQSPSPNSINSSAINVKRENNYDMAINEEAETRVSSRTSDEEEEGGVRKKLRLTKEQSALLEDKFKEHTTLNPKQKQALAKQLNLRPRQVEVWFQNRRARTKLKQTEVDCEVLKRCCESLTDENRRLQKELEELRALKVGPMYMQPTAITICPSCERLGGGGPADASAKARPFIVAPPNAQFLNPFARSAAC